MFEQILTVIRAVEVFVAGGACVVFAISYGVFFQWRKTAAGRALMYFVLSLVALFLLATLTRVLGDDYPGRELLGAILIGAIAVTACRLVWVLWRHWPRSGDQSIESKQRK